MQTVDVMSVRTTGGGKALALRACGVLLLACVVCVVLAGCRETPPAAQAVPLVKTMRVSLAPGADERTYSGVVKARHEVAEAFRVGGRMARRLVDVGDRVRAGQALAVLDDRDYRLSMESAQAQLAAAVSNEREAAANERRYAELLARKVASQAEYDAKHLVADEARARLDQAERARDLAGNSLAYATLRASGDGVVTAVSAEAGQVVAAGQAVATVARSGELEVLAAIPERSIGTLRQARADVTLWADDAVRCAAVLREVAPAADAVSRTYAARFTLRDPGPEVRLGMTAVLHLANPDAAPVARIPASALFNQGDGPGVWVVEPATGHLSLRPVAIDGYTDQDAFVRGQIADGDRIVAAGVQKLDAGMTVRVADAPQEASR